MRHATWPVVLCLWLCLTVSPGAGAEDSYGYPHADAYAATILGTPPALRAPQPEKMRVRELVLEVRPGLKRPEVFFFDEGLRCLFARQEGKAPLIFLISGTGGNHRSPKLASMMGHFYKSGFHVITLPSPTHPNFIISASRSHVPGDLAEDAEDLYAVMTCAWESVRGEVEVTEFCVGGYSLGATQSAFVAHVDAERKGFNFRRVVMVNPAVNLYNSVMRIESLLEGIPGGPRRAGAFLNRMLEKFATIYRRKDYTELDSEFLYGLYREKLITPEESAALIAITFRMSLAGLIFSSDVMTRGGYVVPKERVLTAGSSLREYLRVCTHLSFLNYFDEYFRPHFEGKRPGVTREALIRAEGLPGIEEFVKSSPKFAVMTNEDDFILTPSDLEYLRRLFGERLRVYPRGGHCGNMDYVENVAHMVDATKGDQ
jgi:hypothetical protein